MDKPHLTKGRYDELEKELETLKKEGRIEIAERLKKAKEYGDLSENSEYAEAREEQDLMENRIFELEGILKKAVIIESKEGNDRVRVGSIVTLKKGDDVCRYTIVGPYDTKQEEGKISDESPLGKALLGHKVGNDVTVITPAGTAVYQITRIE